MAGGRSLPDELRRVHRTRAYHYVVHAWDGPVALACSGGIDSTALLLLAVRALRQRKVEPFVVLHVDHRERDDSDDDARFVRQLCERLGVPFELLQFERRLPREQGVSREEQLRDERYRYLAQAVGRLQLEGVVTAHTLDDQAETILMRLISGSGPLGSAGMHTLTSLATTAGTIRIVRPLLDVSRADLEHVLAVAGVSAKEDPSNDSLEYRRNALRHQVMPALRAIEPGFAGALVRSTRLAHDDAVECDLLADQRFEELVQVQSNTRAITRDFVESGSPALLRRIIRRMIFEVLVDDRDVAREVTLERVEAVRLAASKRTGAVIELPGGAVAVIERELVRIMRSGEANDGGGHAAGGA